MIDWTVILDNGKTFIVKADSLIDISLNLQARGVIDSDYDIRGIIKTKD